MNGTKQMKALLRHSRARPYSEYVQNHEWVLSVCMCEFIIHKSCDVCVDMCVFKAHRFLSFVPFYPSHMCSRPPFDPDDKNIKKIVLCAVKHGKFVVL